MQPPGSNSEYPVLTNSKSQLQGRKYTRHIGITFAYQIADKIELGASFSHASAKTTGQIQMVMPGEDGSTNSFIAQAHGTQSTYYLGLSANYLLSQGSISPYASVWIRGGSGREISSIVHTNRILREENLKYNFWTLGPALGIRSLINQNIELDVRIETDLKAQIGSFVGLNWRF